MVADAAGTAGCPRCSSPAALGTEKAGTEKAQAFRSCY